jgi:hypothetical protein
MDVTSIATYALFIGYVIIAILFGLLLTRQTLVGQKLRADAKNKDAFYKSVINAFKVGQLSDLLELENIYKHIFKIENENLNYRLYLGDTLEELFLKIVNEDTTIQALIPAARKDELFQLIKHLKDENKNSSPYANLPQAERNVLNDISQAIANSNIQIIREKTNVLAGMIETREDDLQKVKNINNILTIASVVFAALGIVIYFIK